MASEQDNIKTILELMKYVNNPSQTPIDSLQRCISCINPKFQALSLVTIGGEGLIIKALDETKQPICFKIANPEFQKKSTDKAFASFYSLLKNEKSDQALTSRFIAGCFLQRLLEQAIAEEKVHCFFRVPRVYQITSNPFLYCSMEWIDAPRLLEVIGARNDVKYSLAIFVRILASVMFLHQRGILHRDFKADNILLGKNDIIYIIDWTLAKEIGDRNVTIAGTMGGTPGFSPPKFVSDKDFMHANYRDDIYALGFVFWECVVGKSLPPIKVKDYTDRKLEEYRKQLICHIHDCLQPIFIKATHPKEIERYQTIEAFQNDIKKILEQITKTSKPSVIIDTDLDQKTEIDINEIIISKCKKCGKCSNAFPCRAVRREIIELVFEMKEKGLI